MVSRMPFLDRNKGPAAGRAYFVIRDQFGLDRGPIFTRFDDTGHEFDRRIARRRPQEFDMKIGGDGAIRFVLSVPLHQKIGGRPVRMAIEQRADDPAIQHPRKRLMMRLSMPNGPDFVSVREAVDLQPLIISRPAAEADAVWGEGLL